jgi:hypothetical protein
MMKNILKSAAFVAMIAGFVACEETETTNYTIETVNSDDVVKEYAAGKVIVKYDLNGHEGEIPVPEYVVAGTSVTLAAAAKDKDGNTSKGWALTPDGEVITSYKADQGAVLYAIW